MRDPDDYPSRAELSADAHEEGIEAAADALDSMLPGQARHMPSSEKLARAAVEAYLEALNGH